MSASGSRSRRAPALTVPVARPIALLLIVAVAAFGAALFMRSTQASDDVQMTSSIVVRRPASAPTPASVTLIAVGDVMLSRSVGEAISRHRDVNYPFLNIRDHLATADAVFANLETPITAGEPVPVESMSFRSDPGVEAGMRNAGISVVSLANNHTMNQGVKGLSDTISYLDAAGIAHAGAGATLADALKPAPLTLKGVKFAFLAFNDSDVVPASYGATATRAGTALMDVPTMEEAVRTAKHNADVVIVSMHSGTEYTPTPNKRQTAFARAAIDAGAELVIGHHPHVVQPIEQYKGKWIMYSLGNFVFDQGWSLETREGMIATIRFTGSKVTGIEYTPVLIEDYAQPRILIGKDADAVIARLGLKK